MGIVILIIAAAVALWIQYLISQEFYRTACMKGHKDKKYLWIPFWLGIVGYLLVISLPNLNDSKSKSALSDELPEL